MERILVFCYKFNNTVLIFLNIIKSNNEKVKKLKTILAILILSACSIVTLPSAIISIKESSHRIENIKNMPLQGKDITIVREFKKYITRSKLNIASEVLRQVIMQTPTVILISTKNFIGLQWYSVAAFSSYGVVKLLKEVTKKTRPDSSSKSSFPSGHALSAGLGSTYMQINYGLISSLLLYMQSFLVISERIVSKKHYAADIAVGFYIGIFAILYSKQIAISIFLHIERRLKLIQHFLKRQLIKKAKK